MRLPVELALLIAPFLQLITALPVERRSTPFRSLRGLTPLVNSFSNGHTYAHAPTKYFYESTFNSHYDGRFASSEVPFQERIWHLRLMLKAYTETMERIGVQTWIMHGVLLGWWWGGGLMPWDKDLDFIVEEEGAAELGTWWNMTVHHFDARDLGLEIALDNRENQVKQGNELLDLKQHHEDEDTRSKRLAWEEDFKTTGKKYLIEVNPNYTNKSTSDIYNHIDIRWIDVSTGLYIDITTIHVGEKRELADSPYSSTHPSAHEADPDAFDSETQLYVKDTHAYLSTQLFPLRQSTFEGVKVKVPYAYEEVLMEEYGSDALTEDWYNGYQFDKESKQWKKQHEPSEEQKEYFMEKNGKDVGRLSSTGRIGHGWRGQGALEGALKEEGAQVGVEDLEAGRWTE
ncbi:hypothetical protein CC77DRAFT_1011612 [Alternaria alternata]|jgi:hypothetical protein|uniref:LicD/FKTN/FKRP nucleotidyltransferase domain-containing protein n=1 Tax=Alternaria alternata TaxID=5599 RepID=A0A177DC87_ALTAL|nr:hypothetical protein CC77DRAFT_1011612 [Alternaria alternata]OAG17138.1 hypothetical protein CC77DRAFT_1011612 [Alternaria alternata]